MTAVRAPANADPRDELRLGRAAVVLPGWLDELAAALAR